MLWPSLTAPVACYSRHFVVITLSLRRCRVFRLIICCCYGRVTPPRQPSPHNQNPFVLGYERYSEVKHAIQIYLWAVTGPTRQPGASSCRRKCARHNFFLPLPHLQIQLKILAIPHLVWEMLMNDGLALGS